MNKTPSTDVNTVYGCSDDLVELDGVIYDEFSAYDLHNLLKFDNGATLIVRYDRDGDGIWRIENDDDHPSVTVPTRGRCHAVESSRFARRFSIIRVRMMETS